MAKRTLLLGSSELIRQLESLPENLAKRALKTGVKSGAKVIANEAVRLSPVETGKLRDSITVAAATKLRNKKTAVGYRVLAGGEPFTGDTFYGYMIEYGFWKQPIQIVNGRIKSMRRGRGEPVWTPPQPFMRPALDNKASEARQVIAQAVSDAIARLLKN